MGKTLDLDDVAATSETAKKELDILRGEIERLRGALITGASLLEQGCNNQDMAESMRRAAVPN